MLSDSSCLCIEAFGDNVASGLECEAKKVLMEESIEWFIEAKGFSP
jgi:hypothetical protein